jgi:hypothetical protein
MRAQVPLMLMLAMGLSSVAPISSLAQATEQTQGAQPAATPQKPDTKTAETVKPIASCGFCLEDGTKVPLTLGRELSSATEVTGNRVDFIVAEDIAVNGIVVIPKGSKAMGTVTQAQEKRRMGRAGKLDVTIDEVRLADGQRAKLRASQEVRGKGRQGLMTGAMIGTAIVFFPAAPAFLLMKGKDVVIAQGTPVTSYVDGDTTLEEAKLESAPKPTGTGEIPSTPAVATSPAGETGNKPEEKPTTTTPPR